MIENKIHGRILRPDKGETVMWKTKGKRMAAAIIAILMVIAMLLPILAEMVA